MEHPFGILESLFNRYLVLQVDIPKMVYSGQKLIKLVAKNIPPRIKRINPSVPVTVPVKYKTANTAASNMRIVLSADPMFFFIVHCFILTCSSGDC